MSIDLLFSNVLKDEGSETTGGVERSYNLAGFALCVGPWLAAALWIMNTQMTRAIALVIAFACVATLLWGVAATRHGVAHRGRPPGTAAG